MPQQLLNGPNIVTGFQQMGSKTVPEGVATGGFREAGRVQRAFDGVLQVFLLHMVPPLLASARSTEMRPAGKTYCHAQARAAPAFLRSSAKGR